MINLKASRGTHKLMCLLLIDHLLPSDTHSQSSDGIDGNSALKSLLLKSFGHIIIGNLNLKSVRNRFEALS